ncbi:MAG: aromatic ring-hydroxylating oxygenase subunit alpha [bacterium]
MNLTLEAALVTSELHFEKEMNYFFTGRFVNVARDEELPNTGSFLVRKVAGDEILLTRGSDQSVKAFFNVCRHRGTALVQSAKGTAAKCQMACPYHAWTYDCSGKLLAAPGMKEVTGFQADDWGLTPVACKSWGGFVFVNTDRKAGPLANYLADFPSKFANWQVDQLHSAAEIEYDVAANWKLILQNYSECLHCPSVHPALARLSPPTSGANDPPNSCYLGGKMSLNDGIQTMTFSGSSHRPNLPALHSDQSRHVYYYILLPNLMVSFHPDYVMTHRLEPVAFNRTRIICQWLFQPSTIAMPGFDPADAVGFWDLTNRQDWQMCELTQKGMSSRGYSPGPYSHREHLLFELDKVMAAQSSGNNG